MPGPSSVDVVICTYNNAASLEQVLGTLEAQRGTDDVDWRVLVVDNNCTDETPRVVQRHQARGRLALRRVVEPEQGLTPARRRGVLETDGDWIAFVDDDCLLAEDWVAELGAAIRAHPGAGAIGGEVALVWEEGARPHARRYGWAYAQQGGSEGRRVDFLVGAGIVLRRAALDRTGWVQRPLLADRVGAKLVSGGDVEIALRVGAHHELWYEPRLRLRHVIAARRTSVRHLTGLTYGLGVGKLLADSLVWSGSYPRWVLRSLREALGFARPVAAALRHRRPVDVVVALGFLRGWLVGMGRLARMAPADRGALLGAAALTPR